MFENNGFAFDSAGSFFGESTTPSFENSFSNAGPSDGFFRESAFDENGFSTSETSTFGESASYDGGFTQFGSAFSESAFGEDGFSTDGSNFFVEGGGFLGDAEPVPSGPRVISSKQTRAIRKANDARDEARSHMRQADEHDAEETKQWDDAIKGVPGSRARAEQHAEKAKQFKKKADTANAYADSLRDEVRPTNWVRGKKTKTYTTPTYGDVGPLFGNPRYEAAKQSKS